MKLLIFLFLPLFTLSQTCPPQGDNKSLKIQAADLLKNRSYHPDSANEVSIDSLMIDHVSDTGYVFVDAYITSAKISGKESCNCHTTDKGQLDYHIYISTAPENTDKKLNQIVEVSRYSRELNPSLNFAYVKSLVGHKVRIYGYTFFDGEHKSGVGKWRSGILEIHPVFFIERLD